MRDDELMDQLLKDTLSGEAPRLSTDFDAKVMARVKHGRLTPAGRLVLAGYGIATAAGCAWLMKDLAPSVVAVSLLITVVVAAGLSVYGRQFARGADGLH